MPLLQATTFLQIGTAAATESGEDVAHLLAGLRCVGISGKWADSPESWAKIVPTLAVCRDLRFQVYTHTLFAFSCSSVHNLVPDSQTGITTMLEAPPVFDLDRM